MAPSDVAVANGGLMVHIETLIQNRKGEQAELALGSNVKAFIEQGSHRAFNEGLMAPKFCCPSQPILSSKGVRVKV